MVCLQLLNGKCLGGTAVDACVHRLRVEVQVDSVSHECEDNASEDLATALLLTATMDSLIVERRVMGKVVFLHCCESFSVQAQLAGDSFGQPVAYVDTKVA